MGETQDRSVSRMTISFIGDDMTFEQIKKQLNRSVWVIKVIDLSDIPVHMREILFIKVLGCSKSDKEEIFRIASVFQAKVAGYGKKDILVESVKTEAENNQIIQIFQQYFGNRMDVVRGGSVAIEGVL